MTGPEFGAEAETARLRQALADEQTHPPEHVITALARAQSNGFLGRVVEHKQLGDDRHALTLVRCRFEDGDGMYVVASDLHDGGGQPRMHALSEVVHILQNIGDDERWEIAGREPT